MRGKLTDKVRAAHVLDAIAEIEWRSINGFRNISIHEYFDVSIPLVWQIAQNDIPVLKEQFENLIGELH